MAHYIREKEQQSWLSLDTLMADTGLSRHTVIDARRWLIDNGWIRVLEGSAADMYDNPTQGAHKVRIMCVDDPTKEGARTALDDAGVQELHVQKLGAEIALNVSTAFASAVASTGTIGDAPASTCTGKPSILPSEEDENQRPKQPRPRSALGSAAKWLSRYSEAKPVDFETWSQVDRTRWCIEHDRPNPVKDLSASQTPPKSTQHLANELHPQAPPPPHTETAEKPVSSDFNDPFLASAVYREESFDELDDEPSPVPSKSSLRDAYLKERGTR
jgi:hypothetical protein